MRKMAELLKKKSNPLPASIPDILTCKSCGKRPAKKGEYCLACHKEIFPELYKKKENPAPKVVKRIDGELFMDAIYKKDEEMKKEGKEGLGTFTAVMKRNGHKSATICSILIGIIIKLQNDGYEL